MTARVEEGEGFPPFDAVQHRVAGVLEILRARDRSAGRPRRRGIVSVRAPPSGAARCGPAGPDRRRSAGRPRGSCRRRAQSAAGWRRRTGGRCEHGRQAGPSPCRGPGGKERIEGTRLGGFVLPSPVSVHRDDDVATRHDRRSLGRHHVPTTSAARVSIVSMPPPGHRVAGVDGQVHHHLLDLAGVGLDPPASAASETLSSTSSPIRRRAALRVPPSPRSDRTPRLQHLLPADRQELAGQRRRAFPGVADAAPVVVALAGRRGPQQRQVGGAVDDRQQVVEVVGDAAGEAAQALHLLGLEELRLQLRVVGDVDVRAEQRDLAVAVIEQHGGVRQHVAIAAVLVPAAVLDLEVRRLAAQVLADGRDGALEVLGMEPAAPRLEVRPRSRCPRSRAAVSTGRVVTVSETRLHSHRRPLAGADRPLERTCDRAAPPWPGPGRPRRADVHGEPTSMAISSRVALRRRPPRRVGRAHDEHAADGVVAGAQRKAGHRAIAVRAASAPAADIGQAAPCASPPLAMTRRPSASARTGVTRREHRVDDGGPQPAAVRRVAASAAMTSGAPAASGFRATRRPRIRPLDCDAARPVEHRGQVPFPDDDVVDVAQHRVDAVQPRILSVATSSAARLRASTEATASMVTNASSIRQAPSRSRPFARPSPLRSSRALALQPRPADRQRDDQRDRQHPPERGAADSVRGELRITPPSADDEDPRRARRRERRVQPPGWRGRDVVERTPCRHVTLERDEGEEAHRQRQHSLGRPASPDRRRGRGRGPHQREVCAATTAAGRPVRLARRRCPGRASSMPRCQPKAFRRGWPPRRRDHPPSASAPAWPGARSRGRQYEGSAAHGRPERVGLHRNPPGLSLNQGGERRRAIRAAPGGRRRTRPCPAPWRAER